MYSRTGQMKFRKKSFDVVQSAKDFGSNKSGNFAVFTALAILPFILALGGAIDVLRITNAKATLQGAADAAVLSAASLNNSTDVNSITQSYIESNLPSNDIWDSLSVAVVTSDITSSSREIEIAASATVPSTFLSIAGIDSTEINVISSAAQQATNFEISLVLDISSSMSGNKLTSLKKAAQDFVTKVLDEETSEGLVSINLIPYGGTVNIGSFYDKYVISSSGDDYIDADDVMIDPSESDYTDDDFEELAFLFPNEDENPSKCIEYRHSDYDDAAFSGAGRSQLPDFYVWWDGNPWCPTEESEIFLNSKDADEINDRLDDMTLSDGTGSDIGLLWGVKTLSPSFAGQLGGDFNDGEDKRPAPYDDEETEKILVFMTDGGITWQGRPKQNDFESHERHNSGQVQKTVEVGSYSNSSSNDTAYGRLKKLCENLEGNGVKVYTIGFQIGSSSSAAKQMEDCAVNGGNYYLVETLDIEEAFEAIFSSISNLRITG